MADTLDSLRQEINNIESAIALMSGDISDIQTDLHNLTATTNTLSSNYIKLNNTVTKHTNQLADHDTKLKDHNKRLIDIEVNELEYSVVPFFRYHNRMMLPDTNPNGSVNVYMPPFTRDELREVNPNVNGLVEYKWYQKIVNIISDQGSVTFDFDESRGYLKSFNLGPHSQINIPIPILIHELRPNRRILMSCSIDGVSCLQQFMEYEKEDTIITLYNFTNSAINIQTNKLLIILVPIYGYTVDTADKTDY